DVRNAFADDAGFVFAALFELLLVHDADVLADAAILVEDRAFDVAAAADAERRLAGVQGAAVVVVEKVGPHDDGVLDCDAFADDAPQADDAVFNCATAADLAAVGDQTMLDHGVGQARRRQKTRPAIDWGRGTVKIERRMLGGEANVGVVKRLDRADVFPVAVEEVDHDSLGPHRRRKYLLAEI